MIRLVMAFLLVCCLTLATVLDTQFQRWHNREDSSAGVLVALMGDSRRLFAHEFFAMADSYFHSGFYPTIFDAQKPGAESDLKEESHEKPAGAQEHEEEASFLGAPKDCFDRFGRHFYPVVHTHLHGGNEREMLPWLKLSAELDPHETATYLTASYWLRTSLNKPDEAVQFLREGLRANPDSYEILLELGRVYFYNWKNNFVARNLFVLASQKWRRQEIAGKKPDPHAYEEILGEMVKTDRAQGDPKQEISDLEELMQVAPAKESLQHQIDEAKARLAAPKR
jgi:tetratricopeptide (TPR) repeat protein